MTFELLAFELIPFLQNGMQRLHLPRHVLLGGGVLLVVLALWLLFHPRKGKEHVAKLGGLTWRRNQFCRGWLITGDTGSGKTSSGINQLAHQVFRNEPHWGGLCIDEKGF